MNFYLLDLFINPDSGTIIWMTATFLLAWLILRRFAWKPLLNALKERHLSIARALRSADRAKEEMAKLQVDNQRIMKEAQRKKDLLLTEAEELKTNIIAEAKEQAKKEAQKIISETRKQIENEKSAAINDIKKQIAELSVDIAEKILRKELAAEGRQEEMIGDILKDLKLN